MADGKVARKQSHVSENTIKKVKIKFQKAKCVSNRYNDLFKRKKYFRFGAL